MLYLQAAMLLRTTISVLASFSYLLISLAPCPDLTFPESERTAARVIKSVQPIRAQAKVQTQDSHDHHKGHSGHAAGKLEHGASHDAAAPHHAASQNSADVNLALQLTIPCPCGCGGKKKSAAAGGKLGPRIPSDVAVINFSERPTAIPSTTVILTERAVAPQKPIPIASLIHAIETKSV